MGAWWLYIIVGVHDSQDEGLHFKFQMSANPSGLPVFIQLFLGRSKSRPSPPHPPSPHLLTPSFPLGSENLWVLANLTESLAIGPRGSFEMRYNSFSSNNNQSNSILTSFAHSNIRDLDNFSVIFDSAVENDYTSHMWDGDVTLILYVRNLNSPSSFRITVDQENFIYLLYFFATFIT